MVDKKEIIHFTLKLLFTFFLQYFDVWQMSQSKYVQTHYIRNTEQSYSFFFQNAINWKKKKISCNLINMNK